jgi:uncharacterized repeat protein (TIGR01451 family)
LTKSTFLALRVLCLSLCLAVAGFALRPEASFASGEAIAVTPNQGPVGSLFTVSGSGFTTSTVYVYFGNTLVGTAPVTNGSIVASFRVPNVSAATYSVTVYSPTVPAGFSQAAAFTVTTGAVLPASLSVQKYVQTSTGYTQCASSGGCTIQNAAGNTITYGIQYQYVSSASVTQLVVTDTLAAGQTFVSASPGCAAGAPSTSTGLVTVTCTFNALPPTPASGASGTVGIVTQPVASFAGVIANQACATESGYSGQTCSNTTYVTVVGATGGAGTTQLCGVVTAYTPPIYGSSYGTITIGGQTFTISPTAQITGAALSASAPYNSFCIQFTFVNSQATALAVTSNLAAVNEVCGIVSVYSPTSFTVGGVTYSSIGSVYTGNVFVSGGQYCFLVQNNVIVGVLSGTPTAATVLSPGGHLRSLAVPD